MYTQEQNELLAKVEQLQKERSISQNEVGKLIGISGTALSQIKNGKYAADPQKVFDKIAEYFGVKEKAQLTYTELKFVSTSISAQIYDIIGACQVKGGLAVAAGDAGIGKTKAAQKYIEDHPTNSILITVNPCLTNIKSLLKVIADRINAPQEKSRDELWLSVARKLSDGQVLIFDEAQHLTLKCIEVLRSFSDYLTAQLLDADYSAVCYSGHGIVSGYTNDGTKNIDSLVPPYYEMVGKPKDYQTQWDFSKNPADVIVLNLGTNDDSYASKDLETRGAEYQELYEDFLKQIRKCNPDANIICTLGIMGATELYPYIEAAVNEIGDSKITCYESPVQDMNDLGADWHPSSKTHEKNAYLLADKISTVLGRPSDKIGIDLAADSKLESDIITESGANAWPYYAEWNRSMNVNISAAGNSPESITVYVPNLVLPTGKYELSFKAEGLKGEMPYEVRSMKDPKTVYASGTTETETTLKAFDLCESADDAEIVFMIGEQTGSITFSDVTLYKRANL